MLETLIIRRSQMKSDKPAINIKTFRYFIAGSSPFILGGKRQTFGVPTRRFWAMKLGDKPASNLKTQVGTKLKEQAGLTILTWKNLCFTEFSAKIH